MILSISRSPFTNTYSYSTFILLNTSTSTTIILDAKTRAQEEYNNKMEATRVEADHMLEKAKSDIANEQEKATRDAQAKIAELALLAAKKIMKTGEAHDAGSSK